MIPIRIKRRNDGQRSSVQAVLPIDPRLMAKLLAYFGPEQRAERVHHVYHGPKAARGHPPVRFSDEQVLALRRMREWLGMSHQAIADAVGVPVDSVIPITLWRNRVHLDPGPRPKQGDIAA